MRISDWSSDVCSSDLLSRLGRIPDVGDCVDVGGAVLQVSGVEGHRITEVELTGERHDTPDSRFPARIRTGAPARSRNSPGSASYAGWPRAAAPGRGAASTGVADRDGESRVWGKE